MDLLLQTVANGVLIGGIYAALAIGFQLAFGVFDVVDFAVGGWVMLGGYLGYGLITLAGFDEFAVLVIAFVAFAVAGAAVGPLVYRVRTSRYARPALMALAFTFGIGTLMRGGALTVFGFNTRAVTSVISGSSIAIAGVTFPLLRLVAFGLAAAATAAFMALLYGTRIGLAIRATAQRKDYAALVGIDVKRVSVIVYAIYTGLTGAVGVLMAEIYSVTPEVGTHYTLLAFFVVVMAGLGSLGGVLVAGVLLGIMEALVSVYAGASYAYLAVFTVLYLVLVISPRGILRRGMIHA